MKCSIHGLSCVLPAIAEKIDPLEFCMCGLPLWGLEDALAMAEAGFLRHRSVFTAASRNPDAVAEWILYLARTSVTATGHFRTDVRGQFTGQDDR